MNSLQTLTVRLSAMLAGELPQHVSCPNKAATTRLAKRLAKVLRAGDCIALCGELGTGKTLLVNRLCTALPRQDDEELYITSPTYTVANIYPCEPQVAHLDLYRLKTAEDFYALGGNEYFSPSLLTFVEWADLMPQVLPAEALWLHLSTTSENGRLFTLAHDLQQARDAAAHFLASSTAKPG